MLNKNYTNKTKNLIPVKNIYLEKTLSFLNVIDCDKKNVYSRLSIIQIFVALALLLPFGNYIFGAEILINYLYFIFVLLLLSVQIFLLFSKRSVVIRLNKIDCLLILYFLYLTIRCLVKDVNLLSEDRYISQLGLLILFFTLKHILSYRLLLFVLYILIIVSVSQNIIGFLQLFNLIDTKNLFKVCGFFDNPGLYACYIASALPLNFGLFLKLYNRKRTRYQKTLWNLLVTNIITSLVILPFTNSRAAWICIFFSVVVLIILFKKNEIKEKYMFYVNNIYKKSILAISIITLVGFSFYGIFVLKKASSLGRLLIWKVSYTMFETNPVFGRGFTFVKSNYNKFQEEYFSSAKRSSTEILIADNTYSSFNEFFEILIEEGLLGFLLFAMLIFYVFDRTSSNWKTKSVLCSILSILIFSLTSYPFRILAIYSLLYFYIAYISSVSPNIFIKEIRINSIALKRSFLVIVISLIPYYIFKTVAEKKICDVTNNINIVQPAQLSKAMEDYAFILKNDRNYQLCRSIYLYRSGEYKRSAELIENLKTTLNSSDLFILLGNNYKALNDFKRAEEAYIHSSNMVPNRFLPKYLLAKLYIQTGALKKAVNLAKQVLMMPEKVASIEVQRMKSDMLQFIEQSN